MYFLYCIYLTIYVVTVFFLLLLPTSRFPNFVSSCCFQLLVFLVFFLLLLYFQLVIVFPFFFLLLLQTSRFPSFFPLVTSNFFSFSQFFFLLLLPTSRFPIFFPLVTSNFFSFSQFFSATFCLFVGFSACHNFQILFSEIMNKNNLF